MGSSAVIMNALHPAAAFPFKAGSAIFQSASKTEFYTCSPESFGPNEQNPSPLGVMLLSTYLMIIENTTVFMNLAPGGR